MSEAQVGAGKGAKILFPMSGADRDELRALVAYEAKLAGKSMSQACCDLVMRAADVESYPPEIRDRLASLEGEAVRRAAEACLKRAPYRASAHVDAVCVGDDGTEVVGHGC